MALFSRRKKDDPANAGEDEAPVEVPAVPDEADDPQETVPEVSISVSTFRGAGAPPSRSPPVSDGEDGSGDATSAASGGSGPQAGAPGQGAEGVPAVGAARAPLPLAPGALPLAAPDNAVAPTSVETVPGLRDNMLLQAALAKVSDPPQNLEIMNIARQLLQGQVFLRVQGDARALISEGKQLPLSVATRGDERFMLVYSSGAALQASVRSDGQTDTSAVGQPAMTVLKNMLAGDYAGILIDPASGPARAVVPRALIERMVTQADEQSRIKSALSAERDQATAATVAEAMLEAPLYVAVRKVDDSESGDGRMGIAELRDGTGRRILELYSHPLELFVLGRGDQPLPFTAAQLGKALRDHPELEGVIVDGAGPWIRLSREDLAPVIAVAAD